jgi:hypothetical protein
LRTEWHRPWATLLGILIIASIGAAVTNRSARIRTLGYGVTLGCVATVLLIQLGLVVQKGTAFPQVSPRYAVGMIPVTLAMMSWFLGNRTLGRVLLPVLALGSLATFATSVS